MSALIRTAGSSGPDRSAALTGVAPALKCLRQATSLPRLFGLATHALCDDMGFGRAVLFSVRDHALGAESVHTRGAPDEGGRLLERLARAPAPLGPSLHESEALRRGTTVLVEDAAGDARALAPLPGTRSYVTAPVVCEAQAVALVQADHGPDGRSVTELERRALWAFAEGLGCALERCVLEERLRRHSDQVLALMRSTEASVEELINPVMALPSPMPLRPRSDAIGLPERERLDMLTRREREVLTMLAEGETNARIANRLVVTEDTVKTHVKHILRKLGVKNRSQAVCRYFHIRGSIGEPRPAASAAGR